MNIEKMILESEETQNDPKATVWSRHIALGRAEVLHELQPYIQQVEELKRYLRSEKFHKDTTVQVADVLHRLPSY